MHMAAAYAQDHTRQQAYAAELRAIAKYLFEHRHGGAATLLLAEADRAEAGDAAD